MDDFFLMVITVAIIAVVIASLLSAAGWAGIGLYMFWGLASSWKEKRRRRKKRC
jgi:hypothetical protein